MRGAWLAAALLLGGCAYRAPAGVDTAAPAYEADLKACRQSAETAVNKANAKRALVWLASGARRWGEIAEATGSCMDAKGYGQVRWCTADELATGRRNGTVVVTAAGVQCVDRPRGQAVSTSMR